jgi:hypothetical protein
MELAEAVRIVRDEILIGDCDSVALVTVLAALEQAQAERDALMDDVQSTGELWHKAETRLEQAHSERDALRAYIDRDHAEAIRAEEKRDRAYRTHGPWCRCDRCMKLWPTAWKLPALAQGKP